MNAADNASAPAECDEPPAIAFLRMLGKDPAETWFRIIRPIKDGTRHPRRGTDLKGLDLEVLHRDNANGWNIYYVSGRALTATGVDKKTGRATGAVRAEDVISCNTLFTEWDGKPIEWQLVAWQEKGLPEPTVMVLTGGKSVHCYWLLSEPLSPDQWRVLQARLIDHCGSDKACKDPCRVMRLPGFAYIDKYTGKPNGRLAEVVHSSANRYSADEIAACLPPVEQQQGLEPEPPHPVPANRAKDRSRSAAPLGLPPRGMDQIREALACIPRRRPGENNYAVPLGDRDTLWGLVAAVQEASGTIEQAIALMEAHSPSAACGWDVDQVARSGNGSKGAGTFWAAAEAHGFDLTRTDLKRPQPTPPMDGEPFIPPDAPTNAAGTGWPGNQVAGPFKKRPDSVAKWGKRSLGFGKRLQCLERCISLLAARERNSLRRRIRLQLAAQAFGLQKVVTRQDLAAKVLEAKDKAAGNGYKALTAADRAAMEKPVIRWVLPCLIPANDLTIIGGRPKVGKTRLAVAIVAAVLRGQSLFDLPEPAERRPVLLVTDDQSEADSHQMMEAAGISDDSQLIWSKNFRLTDEQIEELLRDIEANPGALVVIDSLRSISRALQYGENDPEIGAVLYDLKQAVMDVGGTLLLIHHCNKAMDLVGVEALSGHNAISGAANTVLTMHYLPNPANQPNKGIPERRLVREGRSGDGFDLVITRAGSSFRKVGVMEKWQEQAEQARKLEKLTPLQQDSLDALDRCGEWMTRRQVCDALQLPWGDRGQSKEAKNLAKALKRLVDLRAIESTSVAREITYRSHGAQKSGDLVDQPVTARDLEDLQQRGSRGSSQTGRSAVDPLDPLQIPQSEISETQDQNRQIPTIPTHTPTDSQQELVPIAYAPTGSSASELKEGDQVELHHADGNWRNGWLITDVVKSSIGPRYRIEADNDFRVVGPDQIRLCDGEAA